MTERPLGPAPLRADDLRAALAAGLITPHYQPIVAIRSGRIMQVEALARWVDPQRGSVPPTEFIPLAERSGLVGDITTLMIEHGLRDLTTWRARAPGLRVAVNLSAESLAADHFPEEIGRALADARCESACLGLEITEGVLMHLPEPSLGHIERLRAMGVHVAIDDFGTGYSSLKYLQLLPVDAIKIDRQFIATAVEDRNSQIIVRSVVALCHALGFGVVAEGVADREVWDLLSALACDSAQGYFMARPMPPEAVGAWIDEWQRDRPAATEQVMAEADAGRPRILVVDEEPTIVSLIQSVLTQRGYRVHTALNGLEALEAVDRARPDLILLEVHLPIVDGQGVITELRARRIDVPVIVMTAGPSATHWARKLKAEASIAKPFTIDELMTVLGPFAAREETRRATR